MSLKSKYILSVTVILTVTLGISAFIFMRAQESLIKNVDMERAALQAYAVRSGLAGHMVGEDGFSLKDYFSKIQVEGVIAARLYDPGGTIRFSTMMSETGNRIKRLPTNLPTKIEISSIKGKEDSYFDIHMPLINEESCRRCHASAGDILGYLNVSVSMADTLRRIGDLRTNTAIVFVALFIVISIALWMITSYLISRPFEQIKKTITDVEKGNINARFLSKSRDEIAALGESLNSMLSNLSKMKAEVEAYNVENMQKVEKMTTINELAGAIAHEIKNPLAGISGAVQVFAEEFPADDPRLEIIEEIQKEVERLDKAVRDLVNFARPPEPNMVVTSIAPVVEQAVRFVTGQAKKMKINVNIVILDEMAKVHIDIEQIRQVFLNIIMNAFHSMPGGGTLTIATHVRPENRDVEVSFSDTGHGILQENLKNIFEPYYTTKHSGTGLGLAISKNILEKQGGRILVESTVGAGSNFRVFLPLEEENVTG